MVPWMMLPLTIGLSGDPVMRFGVTEIPVLDIPGAIFSDPLAINDAGQVCGESGAGMTSVGMHAFIWSQGQEMIDLNQGSYHYATAMFINDDGFMAGDAHTCPTNGACTSQPLAIDWTGTITELEAEWTGYLVMAGINNTGTIIFNRAITQGSNYIRPRRWHHVAGTEVLEIPEGAFTGYALGLNDHHTVVGYTVGAGYFATMWTDGPPIVLPTEPGDNAWAYDINNDGIAVGKAGGHAARWLPEQAAERLIFDEVSYASEAKEILEDGSIIGTWSDVDATSHAFRIAPDGSIVLFEPMYHEDGTFENRPVAGTSSGWVLTSHMSLIYDLESMLWTPQEGWIAVNQRLVGPGSDLPTSAVDMNDDGIMITRGQSFWTPMHLSPLAAGDVDGDGIVGVNDVLGILDDWGFEPPENRLLAGDVNADGVVDVNDILGVIGLWH